VLTRRKEELAFIRFGGPGIFNAFSAITGFIGVYVAGSILQRTNNNWALVFSFTALQCVVGAVVYGLRGTGNKIIG